MANFLLIIIVFGFCVFVLILLDGAAYPKTSVVTKTPMSDYEVSSAYREMQEYTKLQLRDVKFAGEKVVMKGKVVDIEKCFDGNHYYYVQVKVENMLVVWNTSRCSEEYLNYKQNSEIRFEGTITTYQSHGRLALTDITIKK